MAVIVIPGALQVVCSGQNFGTPWVNVLGVMNESPFILDQSVADEIGEAARSSYQAGQASRQIGWHLDAIQVRDLRTETSPSYDFDFTSFGGTDTVDAMPPQAAIVASHRTNQRGASFRGRTYHSGFSESANTAQGQIGSGFRDVVLGFHAGFKAELAEVTGGPFLPAVLSRKLLEANEIVTTTVDPEWDRQVRRKRT